MRVNFDGVDDSDVGVSKSIPPGEYLCVVQDAQAKNETGADGNPQISYSLRVIEGEHKDMTAGYDRIFFHNDACLKRAKFILRRLGFEVEGELDIDPEEMNNRQVKVKTKLTPKCPDCKWDVVASGKDGEGKVLAKCKKNECVWEGYMSDALQYTAPEWAGYEAVDQAAMSEAAQQKQKEVAEIPF